MRKKTTRNDRASAGVLDLLNEALRLEYSLIVHYPRLANSIKDSETRKLVIELGTASIHHADVVANAISRLGGTPDWSFTPFPDNYDPLQIFQIQLQKEEQALELHSRAANSLPPGPLVDDLRSLANEEKNHIAIVKRVISHLTQT
jgi:bacterioferritin